MKVALLFPPQWYPSQPYLALPTLKAHLEAKRHELDQFDLNIESYENYIPQFQQFTKDMGMNATEFGRAATYFVQSEGCNTVINKVKYYSIRTLKIILLITILLVVLGKIASLSDEEMFKDIEEYYHSFVGIIISVFLLVVFRPRYPMGIF